MVAPDAEMIGVEVAFTTEIFGKQTFGAAVPAGVPKALVAPPVPDNAL